MLRCRVCGILVTRNRSLDRLLSGKEEQRCANCTVWWYRVKRYCKLRGKLVTAGLVAQCIAGLLKPGQS